MKKFLIKVSSFAMIILIILLGYNHIYNLLRADDQYGDGKFVEVPKNITISNIGSSHGVYAFDYSAYQEKETCFNFALVSQTLSYDRRVLEEYKDHLQNDGIMFIPVSYPSFSLDETKEDDFESKNTRYYRFLSPSNIKEFDLTRYIGLHFFPATYESTADIIKIFIKGILHKHPIIEDADYITEHKIDFKEDAQRAYLRHIKVDNVGNLVINEEETTALYSIIRFCRDKDIRPILISTPLREEYFSLYNQHVLDQFYSIVQKVQDETGCEYYDYTHDERFANSDEYMRNADHLSPNGALVFTQIVIQEILNGNLP